MKHAINVLAAVLLLATLAGGLAACGKKGAPSAPGPSSRMTYPRTYPPPD
jgi:predicted small lipoprotein YifL